MLWLLQFNNFRKIRGHKILPFTGDRPVIVIRVDVVQFNQYPAPLHIYAAPLDGYNFTLPLSPRRSTREDARRFKLGPHYDSDQRESYPPNYGALVNLLPEYRNEN